MEFKKDIPTKEDLDFIVGDGYNHDEDPTYEPKDSSSLDDDKYVVSGKEFKKLTRKAKKLGAESLDYSTRKNNKYVATLSSGKKIHFGRHSIQTILSIRIKSEMRDISLELKRLKTNRES